MDIETSSGVTPGLTGSLLPNTSPGRPGTGRYFALARSWVWKIRDPRIRAIWDKHAEGWAAPGISPMGGESIRTARADHRAPAFTAVGCMAGKGWNEEDRKAEPPPPAGALAKQLAPHLTVDRDG